VVFCVTLVRVDADRRAPETSGGNARAQGATISGMADVDVSDAAESTSSSDRWPGLAIGIARGVDPPEAMAGSARVTGDPIGRGPRDEITRMVSVSAAQAHQSCCSSAVRFARIHATKTASTAAATAPVSAVRARSGAARHPTASAARPSADAP
jgi:hypothetical protein